MSNRQSERDTKLYFQRFCVLLIQLQRVKHQQFLHAHDYFQYRELDDVTACRLDPLGRPQKADSLEQDIPTAIQISVEGSES
jgi:hypothetical protein